MMSGAEWDFPAPEKYSRFFTLCSDTAMQIKLDRIQYLDGLRGLAIVSVVLFHAYVAYPEHLPFGDKYAVLPIRLGWQGVELFFLISGFVILMTLERCSSLLQFLMRRWLRLFPAMLIASLIILLFSNTVGSGPFDPKTWINLLPGLTFVSPSLIHSLTGLQIQSMDGTFWSLYVEVVFYAIFGLTYFAAGEQAGIAVVLSLFLATFCANEFFGPELNNVPARMAAAATWMGFIYFGWFACGSLFYLFTRTKRLKFVVMAVAVGAASALSAKYPITERLGLLITVMIFLLATVSDKVQIIISHRSLVFFGFISYPLYLVHYLIATVALSSVANYAPTMPTILLPMLPLMFVTCLAWLIARFGEPIIRHVLRLIVIKIASTDSAPVALR
jgi:peptidoglycan/LPS O-acetylase OafA/YrhL